ncbi:MAG: DUF190 domain-containing protein [Pseudomonadota bacterium]|uniref:DUF190 domain-containing protein n=1 Tax=Sphingobium phenoxybenzoativorans TaxID=1592790 RepID=UPI0008728DCA|nr:DUF190 domain-containing protein [Sphingobium phenoxybenzoativorans]
MHGFQVTFFTQQDRMHGHMPLAQWLLDEAKKLSIRGATLDGAIQGLGHDGTIHAINMFDFSDQPVQVTMVVTAEEVERLFTQLAQEQVHVFYMKVPVEFGTLGKQD